MQWLKTEQKILITLTPEKVSRIVNRKAVRCNEARAYATALTALDTGLRIGELLGLMRPDVDLENLVLRVEGKGNKHRLVPMSIELRKVLYRHLGNHKHALVFATRNGSKPSQRNLSRDFKILCARAAASGVRCSFHTLRQVNHQSGGNDRIRRRTGMRHGASMVTHERTMTLNPCYAEYIVALISPRKSF